MNPHAHPGDNTVQAAVLKARLAERKKRAEYREDPKSGEPTDREARGLLHFINQLERPLKLDQEESTVLDANEASFRTIALENYHRCVFFGFSLRESCFGGPNGHWYDVFFLTLQLMPSGGVWTLRGQLCCMRRAIARGRTQNAHFAVCSRLSPDWALLYLMEFVLGSTAGIPDDFSIIWQFHRSSIMNHSW